MKKKSQIGSSPKPCKATTPQKTCPQNKAHQKSPQHVPRVPGPRVQFPSIKQSYTLCAFLHNNYFVDVAQLLVNYNWNILWLVNDQCMYVFLYDYVLLAKNGILLFSLLNIFSIAIDMVSETFCFNNFIDYYSVWSMGVSFEECVVHHFITSILDCFHNFSLSCSLNSLFVLHQSRYDIYVKLQQICYWFGEAPAAGADARAPGGKHVGHASRPSGVPGGGVRRVSAGGGGWGPGRLLKYRQDTMFVTFDFSAFISTIFHWNNIYCYKCCPTK